MKLPALPLRGLMIVVFAGFSSLALAQPEKDQDPLSYDRNIRGLFQRYCFNCHNENKARGDISLAQDENPRMITQRRKVWQNALQQLRDEAMPPDDSKQPPEEERKLMIQFLELTLGNVDCASLKDPGRPSLRRLNREEYNNATRALTGLNLRLADEFPPDPISYGFDNIAESLTLTDVQVEQYYRAAQQLLTAVIDQKDKHPDAYRQVVVTAPDANITEEQAARTILERFATRAFRRPVEEALVDRYMSLYQLARQRGEAHEAALKHLLSAVLISPRFLMRIEATQPDATEAYPVDEYDLASRLSFLLWSGPPDDELLKLAGEKKLHDSAVLDTQLRRMLQDDRSVALVDNFFGQWLQVRNLDRHQPDAKKFPEFDNALREAMRREVQQVLLLVVREDRPLTELLASNYTFVNERLAKHYGIKGISGDSFQKVSLENGRRGGLLTSAAILMLQSDPGRPNVPRRGNYIAGTILGVPPPPPPPNVPPLEDKADAAKQLTLREMLELHRQKSECASCHAKIDPLGFGFQNYDAIGRWSDVDAGKPIDASGELPNGERFNGPEELKQILLARKDDFTKVMIEQLLIYALGRGLEDADECVVKDALKAAQEHEYRFSAVLASIVHSYPFLNRRNPEF